jgi:hypothetical protein
MRGRGEKTETIDAKDTEFGGSHFGADLELVHEMRRFFDGGSPIVSGRDGLEAGRMIFAAFESLDNKGRLVEMKGIPDARV